MRCDSTGKAAAARCLLKLVDGGARSGLPSLPLRFDRLDRGAIEQRSGHGSLVGKTGGGEMRIEYARDGNGKIRRNVVRCVHIEIDDDILDHASFPIRCLRQALRVMATGRDVDPAPAHSRSGDPRSPAIHASATAKDVDTRRQARA